MGARLISLVIALIFLGIFGADAAFAQSEERVMGSGCKWLAPEEPVSSGRQSKFEMMSVCSEYPGITNKAVKCISRVLLEAVGDFLSKINNYYTPIVYLILLLAFVIFGMRVSLGQIQGQNLKVEAPMFLIKVAFIVYFAAEMPLWFEKAVCITGDFINVVAISLTEIFSYNLMCNQTAVTGTGEGCIFFGNQPPADANDIEFSIWKFIDCIIGSFFSFIPSTTDSTASPIAAGVVMAVPLGLTIIGVVTAAAFSGFIGMAVFFAGLSAAVVLIFSILKMAFNFLVSIIALCMMFAIGPLFIPLVLFKATSIFFHRWLDAIIQYILEPLLLVGFMVLTVWMYDWALFSSDQSLVKTISLRDDKVCTEDFRRIQQSGYIQPEIASSFSNIIIPEISALGNSDGVEEAIGNVADSVGPLNVSNVTNNVIDFCSHPAFANCQVGQVSSIYDISPEMCASCKNKQGEQAKLLQEMHMQDLLASFIMLLALSYMVLVMLEQFPTITREFMRSMSAAGIFAPSAASGSMTVPLETNLKSGISAMQQYANDASPDGLGQPQNVIGGIQNLPSYADPAGRAFVKGALGNGFERALFEKIVGPLDPPPPVQPAQPGQPGQPGPTTNMQQGTVNRNSPNGVKPGGS